MNVPNKVISIVLYISKLIIGCNGGEQYSNQQKNFYETFILG